MTDLVVALFDIETANRGDGAWTPSSFDYAVGVVRFVRYSRTREGRVHRALLAENVHFGPVPLIDDILRPWVHAAVGYNAHQFDIPVAVANAVWAPAGHFATAPGVDGMLRIERWGNTLLTDAQEAEVTARIARQHAHSRLILPGTVGIGCTPSAVETALRAKTFDPLAWLNDQTDHPHVCRLDWLREGLTLKPFQVDGHDVDGAAVPGMWQRGQVWQVVAKCRADVVVMEEMLHQALGMGRLFTNKLNTTLDGAPRGHADVFKNPHRDTGGIWEYLIPTTDWWDRLETIAQTTR